MRRQVIYVVCAEGEEVLAEKLAEPLQKAGYEVAHNGTISIGESLIGEAEKAVTSGSPIVLCATARAVGSAWAHRIINAAHSGLSRVFVVQMERHAYVSQLALDGKIARYCDDPAQAIKDLLEALAKHFPPTLPAAEPTGALSPSASTQYLDQPTDSVSFDIEELDKFRAELREEFTGRYPPSLTAWEFLSRMGLWVEGRLTGTGALLFAKNAAIVCPTSMVKCTRYYGVDRAASREMETFDGTVQAQIFAALQFVASRVRTGEAPRAGQAQSAVVYKYPMIAVREVIANAVVHRDYTSTDSCVHVRLFADRLEVSSPGTWFGRDLTLSVQYELSSLSGHSKKRNFRLAHDLSLIRLVEGEGTGIPTAVRDCEANQSPIPTVIQDDGFVTVVICNRGKPKPGHEEGAGFGSSQRVKSLNDSAAAVIVQPAETPAGLGKDAKYCPQCPGWYRLSDIKAIAQDGTTSTADKVLLTVNSSTKRSRLFGGIRRSAGLTQAERANIAAKSYKLECPMGHELISTQEPSLVVGVIGAANSSKSHYLAGLVYELIYEQRLSSLDADVAYIGDTGAAMDKRIAQVYRDGKILSKTERGKLSGPFIYRLTRHIRTAAESRSILTFFDVAGEDCVSLARQADFVRYLFGANGIVMLIDPTGLPSSGSPLSARGEITIMTRAIIDNLADAFEAVTGRPSRELEQIICISIAKADSADLPAQVWPPEFWLSAGETQIRESELRAGLKNYSEDCRRALALLGGQGIISAAETRFRSSQVHYSAVSATNQAPVNGLWEAPQPIGCSIPLAQILCFGNVD